MKRLLLYFVMEICLGSFGLLGQETLRFRNIGVSEGLSNSSVTSLYQDEFGMMWIGTQDGLNRYDGVDIDIYRPVYDDPSSIYNNNIKSICGDGKGNLYVICKFALCHFDLRTEKFTTLCQNGIQSINHNNGTLWAATSEMVYRLTPTGLDEYHAIDPSYGKIITIYESASGILYIGTDNGLLAVDSNKKITQYLKGIYVLGIYEDSKRNIWAMTRREGVYRLGIDNSIVNFRHSSDINSLCSNYVRSVCEDIYGNYWIGTLEGLNVYNSQSQTMHNAHIPTGEYGIEHMSVYCIARDRQNSMWICSRGGIKIYNQERDVYRYHNKLFQNPQTGVINDIVEDTEHHCLYFASEDTGIMRYNTLTETVTPYPTTGSLSANGILSLYYESESKTLWAGTQLGGLNRIDIRTGRVDVYRHQESDPSSIPHDNVRRIIPYGDKLVLATNIGAVIFDKRSHKCTKISSSPLVDGKYITDMFIDADDNCWIAVSRGLFRRNLKSGEQCNYFFDGNGALGTNHIVTFFQDSKKRLWIGSSGSGLLLFHPEDNSFECINSRNSQLIDDYILGIAESASGYILLTTNNGLVRYDHEDKIFYNYNKDNGFPLMNLVVRGLFVASDNTVYAAGYKSVISFKENRLVDNFVPDNIYFTHLEINNSPIKAGDPSGILDNSLLFQNEIDLYKQHTIFAVDVSTSDFIAASHNIEYKLDGFNDQWIKGKTGQKIVYTNLAPKTYKLRVRCTDRTSGEVVAQNSLTINVHPPFYATTLAFLIYFLIIIIIAVMLINFYSSKLKLRSSLAMEKREKQQIQEMNQSKLQFFTYVSHEIRTPVTLIQSQVDYLLQKNNVPPFIYNKVLGIQRNLQKINRLINELLDFKKHEQQFVQMSFMNQNLIDFLGKIVLVFKEYSVGRNVDFSFNNRCGEQVDLWFDAEQLDKVFYNLISNAFKNTPQGGKIEISVDQTDKTVEISVSDTGCGIPERYQQSIFSPFFQVPDSSPSSIGTGLGLYVSQKIISSHKGELTCTSREGEGSVFKVTLLKGDAHIPSEQKKQLASEDQQCVNDVNTIDKKFIEDAIKNREKQGVHCPTIMIVEDNDDLRSHLATLFEPLYTVMTARDGMDAWEKMEHNLPDIILSDLMMPNMDGNELCVKVKNNFNTSHIPFVMLTAKVADEATLESFNNGADDYMAKPFNSKILISKCNNLVNTRIHLQHKFARQFDSSSEIIATNAIDQEFITKAIQIVNDNITNSDFDVTQLASEMALGRTRLFAKLKGVTGQTPNRFITTIRLKRATEIINNNPDLSISEVSYMTGFSTPSYFIKTFKSIYGVTPATYKTSQREKRSSSDK